MLERLTLLILGRLVFVISEEFGERWLHSIEYGFRTYKENVPIYIAEQKK